MRSSVISSGLGASSVKATFWRDRVRARVRAGRLEPRMMTVKGRVRENEGGVREVEGGGPGMCIVLGG